jgi:predicted PurR-regulated permease PerM
MAENDLPTPEHENKIQRWDKTTKVVIAVLLVLLAGLALYLVRVVFVPLIIGGIMAYILAPVVGWINRRLRIPRGLATGIVYLLLLAIVVPLPVLLVPWGINQIGFLRREFINFVAYLDTISADTVQIMGFELVVGDIVDQVTSALTDLITTIAPASLSIVFGAAETLLMVIFTFLIGFYLTADSHRFIAGLRGLVPRPYLEDMQKLGHEIDLIWSAFFRGQLMLAVVVAILLTGVSALIGLPQPVLIGVLGGLLEFLPSVGHAIFLIIASILALVEGSSTLPVSNVVFLFIVIGVHTAYTQLDLNFLIPRIIGRQVHLHPMVVIIGIIIGASVGGVLGIALAAPTIASLRVLGRYVYARLFDSDPFPMVGPPSAPQEVRRQQAEALAAAGAPALPSPREALQKIRQQRSRKSARQANPDNTAEADQME